MNFLQLVQRVRQECSIAGTGPASVVNQTGQLQSLVDWTADAWNEIQGDRLWSWQWEAVTLSFAVGEQFKLEGIPSRRWSKNAFRETSEMTYVPWETFRRMYPVPQDGDPRTWSVRPDGAFMLSTKPVVATSIAVERYAIPTQLDSDDDIPAMPARYHMAVVWKAVMKYAEEQEAGVLRATAQDNHAKIMMDVFSECTPDIQFGAPLL